MHVILLFVLQTVNMISQVWYMLADLFLSPGYVNTCSKSALKKILDGD